MTAIAQPSYTFPIHVDGIFGGSSDATMQEAERMLKYADQQIDDVQITGKNGYGKVLGANIIHHTAFPVNAEVLKSVKSQGVSIDGIWGGDSYNRINQTVGTLKGADQMIVNVAVTGQNGYGKILGARIDYISKYQYQALMAAPAAAAIPSAPVAAAVVAAAAPHA